MKLIYKGHTFGYEIEKLCSVFFHYEKMETVESREETGEENLVETVLRPQAGSYFLEVFVRVNGKERTRHALVPDVEGAMEECERKMAEMLFWILCDICQIRPKWGLLTGVRPIKLFRRLKDEYGDGAQDYFEKKLLVSHEKAEISRKTEEAQTKILRLSKPESFSLYISIPFCPTRCSYCSFVSQSVERAAKLVPEYVDKLCRELEFTGGIVKHLGLRLETIYFGGGTPTTLSAEQLDRLIRQIRASFDLSDLREFTIEAGRPDTITEEKLLVMKEGGVGRISINPQTMNDEVLERIGRRHTSQQTIDAFHLARKCGFDNINMDTIAGLPGESAESFCRTIRILTGLEPESITVHTLALKRSSRFNQEEDPTVLVAQEAEKMVQFTMEELPAAGYFPYYLYRQSRMLSNLENIGWAKPGFESLYNVYIMEETHSILACGAGAVTKLRQPGGEYIERIFNFKFPYEYNSRFEEMMKRKEQVLRFYEQYQ